jgi:hypothetical protein
VLALCRWVFRTFHRWGLSNKRVQYWAAAKFTIDNLLYYLVFICEIRTRLRAALKYVDEASFERKSLELEYGWSEEGRRLAMQRAPGGGDNEAYTCFCLSDLTAPSGWFASRLHTGSNKALDFLDFVLDCLDAGRLQPGDTLVLDNASIHKSVQVLPVISVIFDFLLIELVFMPILPS